LMVLSQVMPGDVGPGCISHPDGSAGRRVAIEVEHVGRFPLGSTHIREQTLRAGPAFAAVVVEQHGLLDAGQLVQQRADGEVAAGLFGLAAH
jgi:hypothetical protein